MTFLIAALLLYITFGKTVQETHNITAPGTATP